MRYPLKNFNNTVILYDLFLYSIPIWGLLKLKYEKFYMSKNERLYSLGKNILICSEL